jgi:peroxiredoxin
MSIPGLRIMFYYFCGFYKINRNRHDLTCMMKLNVRLIKVCNFSLKSDTMPKKIQRCSPVMILFFVLILLVAFVEAPGVQGDHKTLAIGAAAPYFNLPGVDGKRYELTSFASSPILVVIFTCNHCPTAQAYEDRIIQLARDYKPKGVSVVAIMPNDPKSIRLDELGYTDMGDTYAEMKIRANEKHFNFPYLYDGATETVAKKYGPVATPHVFIFDRQRKLRYSGRIDDVEKPTKPPHTQDARNAIEALLHNKDVPVTTTKVFGCSIKWSEKSDWIARAKEEWAQEPVTLDTIGEQGIQGLIQYDTGKLLLINIWATWSGPCVKEFGDLVDINRMYRRRDFQFISISADNLEKKQKVWQFLKDERASFTNYIFNSDNRDKLIEAVDPKWQGPLPYTILVEPGGKIVYAKQGQISAFALKKAIVDDPFIGRYY